MRSPPRSHIVTQPLMMSTHLALSHSLNQNDMLEANELAVLLAGMHKKTPMANKGNATMARDGTTAILSQIEQLDVTKQGGLSFAQFCQLLCLAPWNALLPDEVSAHMLESAMAKRAPRSAAGEVLQLQQAAYPTPATPSEVASHPLDEISQRCMIRALQCQALIGVCIGTWMCYTQQPRLIRLHRKPPLQLPPQPQLAPPQLPAAHPEFCWHTRKVPQLSSMFLLSSVNKHRCSPVHKLIQLSRSHSRLVQYRNKQIQHNTI